MPRLPPLLSTSRTRVRVQGLTSATKRAILTRSGYLMYLLSSYTHYPLGMPLWVVMTAWGGIIGSIPWRKSANPEAAKHKSPGE